jgi:hypothetical protein
MPEIISLFFDDTYERPTTKIGTAAPIIVVKISSETNYLYFVHHYLMR